MNKIITVLLIVLGVLLVLGFTSLNLEGGNVILYLIKNIKRNTTDGKYSTHY